MGGKKIACKVRVDFSSIRGKLSFVFRKFDRLEAIVWFSQTHTERMDKRRDATFASSVISLVELPGEDEFILDSHASFVSDTPPCTKLQFLGMSILLGRF